MQYELLYLIGASREPEMETIKKEVAEIVTSEGGVFAEKQVTEKRKLAYAVKHESQGFYIAQRFDIEEVENLQAITKKLNLYPNILRSLITKASELPELTSREERKEAEARKVKSEEPKKVSQPKEPKTEKTVAEKKELEEDIDKKLEEILNI